VNGKGRNHSVDTIFVLSLFCVFAVSVLLVLIMGTKSYSAISDRTDDTYFRRTAISYITEKVRHNDKTQSVFISEFCGLPALDLRNEYDGVSYSTYIYLYDGKVCELFCETGLDLPEDAGSSVIEGSALSFEKQADNLLKISYTDPKGLEGSILVSLKSEEAFG
jgi:hypothetical protein